LLRSSRFARASSSASAGTETKNFPATTNDSVNDNDDDEKEPARTETDNVLRQLKESPVEHVAGLFFDRCKHANDSGFGSRLTAILEGLHNNPQTSELFLRTVQDLANKDAHGAASCVSLRPQRDHYNLVLTAWRGFRPPSAKRLQDLLRYATDHAGIECDTDSCNLVLETWAEKGNAERAQAFFDHHARNARNRDATTTADAATTTPVVIDAVSFSHVLRAWSNSRSAVATKRADAMLERMENSSFPNVSNATPECTLRVIECWARSKRKGSEVRIENLVGLLKRRLLAKATANSKANAANNNGNNSDGGGTSSGGIGIGIIDNNDGTILQTAVWNLLQAYHNIENAHRAEEILLEFADDHAFYTTNNNNNNNNNNNTHGVGSCAHPPPTAEMCLSVLSTWSKSASTNRANRAEKLLRSMQEHSSLPNPDTASYTAVLNCIASSKKQGSARRAEALLRRMDRTTGEIDNEDTQIKSNMVSLTCVLIAWARSDDSNATANAERIFAEMLDRGMQPDRFVFAGLITAWGRSAAAGAKASASGNGGEESLEKVEDYFRRLKERSSLVVVAENANTNANANAHGNNLEPTVVEYTAVIQAYANLVSGNVEMSRELVRRAEGLLDEMLALSCGTSATTSSSARKNSSSSNNNNHLRPNILTYAAVLKTIAAARRTPDRGERADAVLQKMYAARVEITPYILNLVNRCKNHHKSSSTIYTEATNPTNITQSKRRTQKSNESTRYDNSEWY